ncbi:MAG TPA: DnaJ domain-containing protein [Kofleriaceae bacterium]|nr:DnaJ domain-containing protein [Kofleriaceae bacterium]
MTELARGTVGDRPWGRTLGTLGLRGLTGQLTLLGDGKPFRIAFDQGAVVGATSPLASDAAVRVALTGGLITSTQVADITRRIATSPHRDEVDVLAEVVRLPADHAMKLRRRLVAQRAARTFSVEQGEFVVEDRVDVPVVPGSALDVRAVIYLGARSNLTEDRLGNEVTRLGGWFRIKPEVVGDLIQFGFTEPDKPILQRLITGVNIDDLEASAADGIGEHGVRAIVYALVACNGCDIEGQPRPSVARTTRETFDRGAIRTTTPPINQRAGGTIPPRSARGSTTPPRDVQPSRTTSVEVPDGMQLRTPRSTTPPARHGGTTTGPFPTVSRTQTPTSVPRTQTPTTPRTPTNPTPTGPMQPRAATPTSTSPPAARTRTGPTPSRTQTPLPQAARAPTPTGPQLGRVPTNPVVPRAATPTTLPATGRVPTNPSVGRAPTPSSAAIGRTPTPLDLISGDPVRRPPLSRIKRNTAAAQETETLIRDRLALLDRNADHFMLLGITQDASADVTRAAYFTLARKLHPDRLASLAISDAAHAAQRLMAQINTAFAILSDPLRRSEYSQMLGRGGETAVREEEAKANAEAMRAMHAEEAFRRGEMALRREQLDQALVEFTTAVELRNNEPEYQAMLAWTRFAASSDKQSIAQETRQKLLRAADHSDHSPAARFYLGRVERILGREREALSHFQEVLRIKPNHAEASSEIRVLEARLRKR